MRSVFVALTLIVSVSANAEDLARLRADYASQFLHPEAHLKLSQSLMERGDRLTAFFVSEAARRGYFGDKELDRAFRAVFRNDRFDNSAGAEERLAAEVAATPDDPGKRARFADIFLSRNQWKKAEAQLRVAIKLAPDTFEYVGALAEVLRRDGRPSEAQALLRVWQTKHPQSVEWYGTRFEELAASKPAEVEGVLEAALTAYPNEAFFHFQKAALLDRKGETAAAAREYVRAAELDKESAVIQGWTARFFLKSLKDNARALQYYLNAYFLDPHFYDTEYAESRIRSIAMEEATVHYAQERSNGTGFAKLLTDSNPVVIALALEEADRQWTDELSAPVIALLAHDDPNNRAAAMMVLGRHLRADDARIDQLLLHTDLRVRGSAAYVAGSLRGDKIVPLMSSWLDNPAELIRYDAISVLSMHGGQAGRDVLLKLRKSKKVREPRLRAMLDAVAQHQER